MSISGHCATDSHQTCPDTHEDLADCDCHCHLAQNTDDELHMDTQFPLCISCQQPAVAYGYTAKVYVTYSLVGRQEDNMYVSGDTRDDYEVDESDYVWHCNNGHSWPVDDIGQYFIEVI